MGWAEKKEEKPAVKPKVKEKKKKEEMQPLVRKLPKGFKVSTGKYGTELDVIYKIVEQYDRISLSVLVKYFGVKIKHAPVTVGNTGRFQLRIDCALDLSCRERHKVEKQQRHGQVTPRVQPTLAASFRYDTKQCERH